MDYLQDYWTYHSCYEIPRNYAFWSGITLIGAVVNRKVHFFHGDIELHGNLYCMLVGPQGNSKSTCCDFSCGFFKHVCPDMELGASTQSAEDIVKVMADEKFVRCYTDEKGDQIEVRPYPFFINEFKDFIAYNPTRMLNFLTNIYDRKSFDASTIKRGAEHIINPCLNILACENPDQLVGLMKNNIMTGGMSRRMIMVYEPHYQNPKPIIIITDEARAAKERFLQRLIDVRSSGIGEFKWEKSGMDFYIPWYNQKHKKLAEVTNPIMRGYLSTKHIQLFKICMLLDTVSDKPMFQFTGDLMELGMAHLDSIELHMPKLSVAAGRNEMAGPQQKILDMLRDCGGIMPEKLLKKKIETELTPIEIFSVFKHLEDTDQVVKKFMKMPNAEGVPVERYMLMTPEEWALGVKEGRYIVK